MSKKLEIEKPLVKSQNKGIAGLRVGRGYSFKELNEAGIKNYRLAMSHRIPVDRLRNTVHKENIDRLRNVTNEINEQKIVVKEKPSENRNQAKPKVIKKRTIRRKLIHND